MQHIYDQIVPHYTAAPYRSLLFATAHQAERITNCVICACVYNVCISLCVCRAELKIAVKDHTGHFKMMDSIDEVIEKKKNSKPLCFSILCHCGHGWFSCQARRNGKRFILERIIPPSSTLLNHRRTEHEHQQGLKELHDCTSQQ